MKSRRQSERIARRPRSRVTRPIYVQVCLSAHEYDLLLEQASAEQLSLGGWIRSAATIVAAQARSADREAVA